MALDRQKVLSNEGKYVLPTKNIKKKLNLNEGTESQHWKADADI